jgi:soluble cytochrome b562
VHKHIQIKLKELTMSESTTGGDDQTKTVEGADVTALQEQLNAVIAERDTLKTQHRDLKNASKNVTDLQKQYDELLSNHSKVQEEFTSFKTGIKQSRTDTFIKTALDASGAHNADRVKAMLDMSALKIADDGTPDQVALGEAINALKTSDSYMFKPEGSTDTGNGQSSGSTTTVLLPEVKGAVNSTAKSAFALELEAARKTKSFDAIQKVIDKFGKS